MTFVFQGPALPIDSLLPAIAQALAAHTALVLEAPPGAGKTTRVPLALLDAPWLAGQTIVMLEPRRLAARAAAARMAQTLGEKPGEQVGYRVRLDSKVSARTRIEVITEGILARRLQDDPGLDGVGLVIFDEFHERSLDADLGLALCLEAQKALRPELRLMAMSATLDGTAVAKLLDAPVLRSEGRAFPVETRYLDAPPTTNGPNRFPMAMAQAVNKALAETDGDLLAFLPGEREIHAVLRQLGGADLHVLPLYGALAQNDQDRVFAPPPAGKRKVVLATSIAETSLTIDGIRVVVDGGLARVPRYDPASGLTGLDTVKVTQAAAEQRRGRAGRTAPGICYRLWPEPQTRGLLPRNAPEILQADLAPLALDLAVWGVRDPSELSWMDAPPAGAFAQARALLAQLGALDADGAVTAHGKAMARLPLHPRLAHMAIRAKAQDLGAEAASLAALLAERDPLSGPNAMRDADLRHRLEIVGESRASAPPPGTEIREATRRRIRESAKQIRRLLDVQDHPLDSSVCGALTALAYPDRVAQKRSGGGFRLANGRGAAVQPEDSLGREEWLAVAAVGDGFGASADGRIFMAAPLSRAEIEEDFAGLIVAQDSVAWDARTDSVQARRQRRLGALLLDDVQWDKAPTDKVAAALLSGIQQMGLTALPWTGGAGQLRARVAFLRANDPQGAWPDLSDSALAETMDDWLAPHLGGLKSRADLAKLHLTDILGNAFDWAARKRLDEWAPTEIAVPSGRTASIDYTQGDAPVLAVKLQELFGLADTPRVANGRVPVVLHLLSPAGRPVQVTRDLANFWREGYFAVKKDLKARYPRHPWPDDPMSAPATARAKPRGT
jgi:ATP-dependent helicase HrpB